MRCLRWRLAVTGLLFLGLGCVAPEDNPSTVKDLRVLGISIEPPEILRPTCATTPAALALNASQVTVRTLIADPAGGGRQLSYRLWACADPEDLACEDEEQRVLLASGQTSAGVLTLNLRPGTAVLPGQVSILQAVALEDRYRGFGGIRVPLVLQLTGGGEEVFAQKLMPFSCAVLPQMTQNLNPVLPALTLDGAPFAPTDFPVASGPGPFQLKANDFSALEEDYVVPAFDLTPVQLKESWKLAWHTTLGTIAPTETGGTQFISGAEGRHQVEWKVPESSPEQEVRFWVVARDGRGGLAWDTWRVTYRP
jgi:hypothetical protein